MRGIFVAVISILLLIPQVLFSSNRQRDQFPMVPSEDMFLGNVSVRVAQSGDIVIIVDQLKVKTPDGIPDLVFRFAPRKTRQQYRYTSFDLEGARIVASSNRLVVRSRDSHVLVSLSLERIQADDSEFAIYGDTSTDLPETIRINRGFGLSREIPKRLDDGTYVPIDIEQGVLSQGFRPQNEDSGTSCDNGGPGATSCSVATGGNSCSVSCSSGYYACCNSPAVCRCIRNF